MIIAVEQFLNFRKKWLLILDRVEYRLDFYRSRFDWKPCM